MNKTITYMTGLVGLICGLFFINSFGLGRFFTAARTVPSDVVQGLLIGYGLALVTMYSYARLKAIRTVNHWVTMFGCGEPGNGPLLRAAHTLIFPGPVNLPREAMYWTTSVDGAGRPLTGRHNYELRFPPGQLPPQQAFWSLTMGDARNRFVANPINRYCVSDRSGLTPEADGATVIYIQPAAPAGKEANWLPAPAGPFTLWLRVYLPGPTILDGQYVVPPVVAVK